MDKWHLKTNEEVINELKSSSRGLTNNEASSRLAKYGKNKLIETKKKGILFKFLEQFKNTMIIVLIIASFLSAFVSITNNEPITDSIIILIVVFLNALLGVLEESKAEKAIESLKKMNSPNVKVKRNNNILNIKVEDLVKGDIVLLESGDYVPADLRIIESHSLKVEESALTGESLPVEKISDKLQLNDDKYKIALADRINMLYSGSSVVYGRCEAVVVETGMNTEIGKIASAIDSIVKEETPLQIKMNEISKILSILVVVIAIIMVVIGIIQGKAIIDVFMLAIALAVAAIPEGLSAVITITLAIGVQKMAKEKTIIRKLSSVETLGSTEIICTDKTGTLTQNKMTVMKVFNNFSLKDINDNLTKDDFDIFNKILTLCNDTKISEGKSLGDPTETALIDFVSKFNIDKIDYENKYKRVDEIPFDSERKLMTTVNNIDGKDYVLVKGAIESLLHKCSKIKKSNDIFKITQNDIDNILNINLELAKNAYRVISLAYKEKDDLQYEENLIFVGLVAMIDPPRKEVKDAVKKCFEAGITPIMITGDNLITAKAIAKNLGIYSNKYLAITGVELDNMSDEELKEKIMDIRVYARVSPENKIRIVNAFKALDKVVAMTGDGVNDAPALKGADIGVGMGITGTEVSKSVSSMILADDNFATIVDAVKEGRRIYKNIQNVIVYLLASNLAEVLIIFISMLFGREILLPIQILWINLITDTIPAIALGFEKEEKDIMKKKPRNKNEKFFNKYLSLRIIIPAIVKSIAIFTLYYILENKFTREIAAGASFVFLSLIEIIFATICRSDKEPLYKLDVNKNRIMLLATLTTIFIQMVVLIVPVFRSFLHVPNFTFNVYIIMFLILAICIIIFESTKLVLYRVFNKK